MMKIFSELRQAADYCRPAGDAGFKREQVSKCEKRFVQIDSQDHEGKWPIWSTYGSARGGYCQILKLLTLIIINHGHAL
jgi:hypothetical protein